MATIREEKPDYNGDGLRLIVRKAEGEEAFLDIANSVKKYLFKLNSDDGALSKDFNIMPELTIEGGYHEDVADKASQFMAEWATDASSKTAYKYVELMRFDKDKIRKRYVFPNAFVVDYDEWVSDAAGEVSFKLYIKQYKDKKTAFKMFVNEEKPAENEEESTNE